MLLHNVTEILIFWDSIPIGIQSQPQGYQIQPCESPPMTNWKADVDFHDTTKINGLDFPSTIRSSKFGQHKDIEGMDPLQVPLWKFLCQGLNNNWLRRIAYGRDVFVMPFDNIQTTVFVAELVQQLKSLNVDIDHHHFEQLQEVPSPPQHCCPQRGRIGESSVTTCGRCAGGGPVTVVPQSFTGGLKISSEPCLDHITLEDGTRGSNGLGR